MIGAGKQLLSRIHGRARTRFRIETNKRTRNIEQWRRMGLHRTFINAALRRTTSGGLSPHLMLEEVVAADRGVFGDHGGWRR